MRIGKDSGCCVIQDDIEGGVQFEGCGYGVRMGYSIDGVVLFQMYVGTSWIDFLEVYIFLILCVFVDFFQGGLYMFYSCFFIVWKIFFFRGFFLNFVFFEFVGIILDIQFVF